MKAIIVDIKGKHAVALNKDGKFIKVKNTGKLNIGYEIDIPSKVIDFNKTVFYKVASVAAMLIVVLGVSLGVYSYNLPYNYVNVDINPSVEITLNMYNRIIDVKALNTDGEKLLHDDSYKNCKLEKGVKIIIDNAVEEGYLIAGEQNTVMLTVAGKNKEKVLKIQERVRDVAKEVFDEDKVASEVLVENMVLERREEAKELGISPGKLVLIEKLLEVNPDATVDEYKDKPVKEIMKSIKGKKEEQKQNNGHQKQDGDKENEEMITPKPSPQIEPTTAGDTGVNKNKGSANGEKQDKDNNTKKDNKDKNDKSKDNNKSKKINEFFNKIEDIKDKYKDAKEKIKDDKLNWKDKEDRWDKDKNRDTENNDSGDNKGDNNKDDKDKKDVDGKYLDNKGCKDNGDNKGNDDDKDNNKGNNTKREEDTDKYERDNKGDRKGYNKGNKGR